MNAKPAVLDIFATRPLFYLLPIGDSKRSCLGHDEILPNWLFLLVLVLEREGKIEKKFLLYEQNSIVSRLGSLSSQKRHPHILSSSSLPASSALSLTHPYQGGKSCDWPGPPARTVGRPFSPPRPRLRRRHDGHRLPGDPIPSGPWPPSAWHFCVPASYRGSRPRMVAPLQRSPSPRPRKRHTSMAFEAWPPS